MCQDEQTLLSTCGRPAGETSRVLMLPLSRSLHPSQCHPHRSSSSFVGQEYVTELSITLETGHISSAETHCDPFQSRTLKKELVIFIFLSRLVAFKVFISNETVTSTSHASLSRRCEVLYWRHSATSHDSLQRADTNWAEAASAACLYTNY